MFHRVYFNNTDDWFSADDLAELSKRVDDYKIITGDVKVHDIVGILVATRANGKWNYDIKVDNQQESITKAVTANLLKIYEDKQYALEAMVAEKKRIMDSIIPREIKDKLAEVEEEFGMFEEKFKTVIEPIEKSLREAVTESGETIKGELFMAVYSKPKETWDDAKLRSLAVLYPEINEAVKSGKPVVSIRKIK